MNSSPPTSLRPWYQDPFYGAIALLFLLSLGLRFWNLGQFNTLVFDEVYYAKFANNYWLGKPFFPSHPPLSHYLIALGMALGSLFPVDPQNLNTLTGSLHSPWSYRWLNALTGSFIPLLIAAIVYNLTQRRSLTLLVMSLSLLDGIYLVESRYALNNIYLVFFGLGGHLGVLAYRHCQRRAYLIAGGVSLGCAGAVKWNGFAFLLAIYILLLLAWLWPKLLPQSKNPLSIWLNLRPGAIFWFLVFLPLLTYSLLWLPHLLLNPEYRSLSGFGRIHLETWQYHNRIGNDSTVHPYCSSWYTWLIMWRPVAYYYQVVQPHGIIYDVHSMANPVLLWFSTSALAVGLLAWLSGFCSPGPCSPPKEISLYLGVNYLVNLLPWWKISRCTFFYHYMPAYLFSWLALALILDRLLHQTKILPRAVAIGILGLIILGFYYWLPLFWGLPLTPQSFARRMLLRSWI